MSTSFRREVGFATVALTAPNARGVSTSFRREVGFATVALTARTHGREHVVSS